MSSTKILMSVQVGSFNDASSDAQQRECSVGSSLLGPQLHVTSVLYSDNPKLSVNIVLSLYHHNPRLTNTV